MVQPSESHLPSFPKISLVSMSSDAGREQGVDSVCPDAAEYQNAHGS